MNATVSVRELKAPGSSGRIFTSVFIVRRLSAKTASNGNPFLSVEFGDRTGSFSCTVFGDSPVFEFFKSADEGAVVRIEGKVESFQGRLSPRLTRALALDEAELRLPGILENLVEVSPEEPVSLWAEFEGFISGIKHPTLAATVRAVFEEIGEAFRNSPAAISMHHGYRHGLLEHTIHMARAGKALLPLYPEIDPDLSMAGILLHDIGKTVEYEGTLAPRRSRPGILQGHVVLGYQLVRKAGLKSKLDPERLERLEHIILSHQGKLEWGAPVLAATPEAVFVSMVDNLDAKMGMVQRTLRLAAEGEEFSERIPGLEVPLLVKPLPPAGS